MKIILFVFVALSVFSAGVDAQLLIEKSSAIPDLERHRKAAQSNSRAFRSLPSFEMIKRDVERTLVLVENKTLGVEEPVSHPLLLNNGCTLALQFPSGVEKQSGGRHGTGGLYQCVDAYVIAYEYDYTEPLAQIEGVVDDEYANDPEGNRLTVKMFRSEAADGKVQLAFRWINPWHKIRLEVYPDFESQSVVESYREIVATAARTILLE